MIPIEDLLQRLQKTRKGKSGWTARCPAHDDKNPSLSVSQGDDGRILLHCYAGCATEAVLKELGLSMRELMPEGRSASRPAEQKPKRSYGSEAEAETAVLRSCGAGSTIAARWEYFDKHGALAIRVLRVETPRGKSYRPIHQLAGGRWALGDPHGPLPLYRLNELQAEGVVLVAEGEKCADELARLGICATTSSHGSSSAKKTDWTPLAGRAVVILPDNDKPGRGYAEDVAKLLSALTPPASVRILPLPEVGVGEDIVDFVELRHGAGKSDADICAEIDALIASAEPAAASTSSRKTVTEFRPFPVHRLPRRVQGIVSAAAKSIGCDPAFVALPMLAVAGSAIGNSAHALIKEGWTEPPILWVAIVAPSGQQKSPVFEFVTKPAVERQREAHTKWEEEQRNFEAEEALYQRSFTEWKSRSLPGDPPSAPLPPVLERFVCDDITMEALVLLLHAQPRSMLLTAEELATWMGGFDQYRGGKGADAARWLSIFGAREVSIDRKSSDRPFIFVPRPNVCIVGGIQPSILKLVLDNKAFASGLAARLLFAMPPVRKRRWSDTGISAQVRESYHGIIRRLYDIPLAFGADGAVQPRLVPMDPDAKRVWVDYFNRHAEEQILLEDKLAAAWSKLEGLTARIALIVQRLRWASGECASADLIDATSMQAAIEISEWCGGETRRVYGAFVEPEEDRWVREAVERIRAVGGSVTVREWHRRRSLGSAAEARADLDRLVNAGVAHWERDSTKPTGGHQPERIVLVEVGASDACPTERVERGRVSVSDLSGGHGVGPIAGFEPVDEEEVVEEKKDARDPLSYVEPTNDFNAATFHGAPGVSEPSDSSDTDCWPPASPPEGRVSGGGWAESSSADDGWRDL
jgi:hypothetical protein